MTPLEKTMAMRTGGATERCHTVLHHGSYSVAAHTWGVLALLHQLYPSDFPRLAAHALFHDVPEAWVGDVPTPTKRYNAAVRKALREMEAGVHAWLGTPNADELAPADKDKVSACDRLELYLWTREQLAGGNQHAACVARELDRFFEETPLPPEADALLREIRAGSAVHATDGVVMRLNDGGFREWPTTETTAHTSPTPPS